MQISCKNIKKCISVFNITAIQVYALTSNAEEAEQFYEDLQDLLEPTPKKKQKNQMSLIGMQK